MRTRLTYACVAAFLPAVVAVAGQAPAPSAGIEVVEVYTALPGTVTLGALRTIEPDVVPMRARAASQSGSRTYLLKRDAGSVRLTLFDAHVLGTRRERTVARAEKLVTEGGEEAAQVLFNRVRDSALVWITVLPQMDERARLLVMGVAELCEGLVVDWVNGEGAAPPVPAFYDHRGNLLLGPPDDRSRTRWGPAED